MSGRFHPHSLKVLDMLGSGAPLTVSEFSTAQSKICHRQRCSFPSQDLRFYLAFSLQLPVLVPGLGYEHDMLDP